LTGSRPFVAADLGDPRDTYRVLLVHLTENREDGEPGLLDVAKQPALFLWGYVGLHVR
jgi:hypothetical protein